MISNNNRIFIANIEKETLDNTHYRKVLYTSSNQQLVIQTIKPNSDIKFEVHNDNDQFVRIEKGNGQLIVGEDKQLNYELSDGIAFIIPKGTWHQIINNSSDDLKLYTIYSPPHHSPNTDQINRNFIYKKLSMY